MINEIYNRINEKLRSASELLISSIAPDYATYLRWQGERIGLAQAVGLFHEVADEEKKKQALGEDPSS